MAILVAAGAIYLALNVINGLTSHNIAIRASSFVQSGPTGLARTGSLPKTSALDRTWAATTGTFLPSLLLLAAATLALVGRTHSFAAPRAVADSARVLALAIVVVSAVGIVTSLMEPIYPSFGVGTSSYFASLITAVLIGVGSIGVFGREIDQ